MLEHDQSSTLEDDHMDDMRADWKTPCSSDNLCFICASHKVVSQQELAVLDTPTNQPTKPKTGFIPPLLACTPLYTSTVSLGLAPLSVVAQGLAPRQLSEKKEVHEETKHIVLSPNMVMI